MNNDDLLANIGKLIDQKIKPLQERQERIEYEQKKQFKEVNRKLNKLEKLVSYIARTYDEEIVSNRRRIERIEDQLDIQPLH